MSGELFFMAPVAADVPPDEAEVEKMKVAELREKLEARGLSTDGNKPTLKERLLETLD